MVQSVHAPVRSRKLSSPPIAVAFIRASTGELHCLLPILKLAKEAHPELRIVVAFGKRTTGARLAEDRAYSAILADLGAQIVLVRDLLRHVLANRRHIRLIFKEFGRTPKGSLVALLKRASPNAKLVLFPHAYALHSTGQRAPAAESRSSEEGYDEEAIDALLLNSQLDVETWAKKLPRRKIRVVGATGYTEWWGAAMRRYAHEHLGSVGQEAKGMKVVLLTTRGPHESFLTDENYQYLVTQAVEVVLSRPDTFIVLKPHPREDVQRLKSLLALLPQDRLRLTGLNTLALASISTLTLSFWSSAVLDSIAVGTPTIEFHRFHRPFPQSVLDDNGRVASIYTTLGLALKAHDRETLSDALETALSDREALLERQKAALSRCFPDNEAQLDTLRILLAELLEAPPHHLSSGSAGMSILKIAILAARDLLAEVRERRHFES